MRVVFVGGTGFLGRRLREVLDVTEPDPRAALRETVLWYWEHGPRPGALYAGGPLPY